MFLWEDGTVTGSINWAELRDVVSRKGQDNVTADGWKRLEEFVAEHDGELKTARDDAAERAKAAADANAEAGALAPDALDTDEVDEDDTEHEPTKAELQEALRERGLPTTGNKAELVERLNEADDSKEE